MGVLNTTPDSFYADSRIKDEKLLLKRVEKMLNEGAFIIDIGGISTRPGAQRITEEEELSRVIPAIDLISKTFPEVILSIDTFRSKVARQAVESGAMIVNDISGGTLDNRMHETVAQLQVPYILMHLRGTPETMSTETQYENLVIDVVKELSEQVHSLTRLGVADIIIDPGFGFAKTIEQNFEILKNLEYFNVLGYPLLAGLSRKSMIYKTLETTPEEALNGTTALNMIALINGARILRVHDVKEAVETVNLFKSTFN